MKLKVSSSHFSFFIISAIGLLIAVFGYYILPSRFLGDVPTILNGTPSLLKGSYPFTTWFYTIATPLGALPYYITGFIQFLTVFVILKKIGVPDRFHILNLKNIIAYLSIIIISIFLCMPTKEYINFVYVSLIVFIHINSSINNRIKTLLCLFLIFFFGFFFRPYYLIIVVLIIFFYYFGKLRLKNKRFNSIFFVLVMMVGMSLSYGVIKGEYLTLETRELPNERRLEREQVNTVIQSPIKIDSWYDEGFSIFYGFFTVNIPFNGFKHILSPHILCFIIWEFVLFVLLYYEYKKCLEITEYKKNKLLFYFLFSFLIVQGVFEPDLGSAVRHKAGFFPIIYYLIFFRNFKNKD